MNLISYVLIRLELVNYKTKIDEIKTQKGKYSFQVGK